MAKFIVLANMSHIKLANMTGLPMMIPLLTVKLMAVLVARKTWS